MTKGGEELGEELAEDFLNHFGVRGMRWGVRNASRGRDAALKATKNRLAERRKAKLESKLSAGEAAASFLVGGPFGLIGYKLVKRNAVATKRENKDLSAEDQIKAASSIKVGEALAVAVVASPVGLIAYSAAKQVAARRVSKF